jgi:hypothetical protein
MLETILTIVAWVAVAAFTLVFLLTIPSLYIMFMEILVIKKTHWPGPPDYDPQSTEYRMAQLTGTQYHPKPLFKGFLENVLGILSTLVIMIVFIFVIIPQLSEVGTGQLIGSIFLQALTILAGAFWIKPTLRSRVRFINWLIRR